MSDSTQHTPGLLKKPSSVGVNLRSYGQSAALCTVDGRQLVAGCFGDVRGGEDQADANARRLVAAWNACDGVPTEWLEAQCDPGADELFGKSQALHIRLQSAMQDAEAAKAQRDELLLALTNLANVFHEGRAVVAQPESVGYVGSVINAAEALIAKHKEASHG